MSKGDEDSGHRVAAELKGDSSRQATSLFGAIDYQIWQTVLAWIDLRDEELLIVEGAEDFDVIGEDKAVAIQIKRIAAPITLRSECVGDAIRNYWIAKNQNPGRRIKLRLVTTAEITTEARAPFGTNAGLKLWQEDASTAISRHSDTLLNFLTSDASIRNHLSRPVPDGVGSLNEILAKLSPEAFHSEFVSRIEFLTSQPDVDIIREMVRVKLQAFGENQHLSVRDSERALQPLFEFVASKGMKQKRALTRADFRDVFDGATRVNIAISQYEEMKAAVIAATHGSPQRTELNYSTVPLASLPDLPIPCAMRTELVQALTAILTIHGFVTIQGSTGKGKSTVGKLVARSAGGRWNWVSFTGLQPNSVTDELGRIACRLAAAGEPCSLLLDDLNAAGSDVPLIVKKLAILSRISATQGGRIIVTTQRLLGDVFLRQSNLPPAVLQSIASFDAAEIAALCREAGCPSERIRPWAAIIAVQTGFHPQLVHARVKVAARNGWQLPGSATMSEAPREIQDERQLARQLLKELDPTEVDLLYRLSLATSRFRKDHAIAVADVEPRISSAGDKFDGLVGPWIEPAGTEYFRLSQLLSNAAVENWTPQNVHQMRIAYAAVVQKSTHPTLIEASEVLMQAVITRESTLAGPTLAALMMSPMETRSLVSEWLNWMPLLPDPAEIFPDSRFVQQIFSTMQFRIAVANESDSAPQLAQRLYQSSVAPIDPEIDPLVCAAGTTEILLAIKTLVPPELLLKCWLVLYDKQDASGPVRQFANTIDRQRSKLRCVFPDQDFCEIMFGFVLSRRASPDYLNEFIDAVEALSESDRKKVVGALNANIFRLFNFVDNAWTDELSKAVRDWRRVIKILERTRQAGRSWQSPELSRIAARAVSAIYDEYLDDKASALSVLAETAAQVGDGLMTAYQRGMVHYLHGDYEKACAQWYPTLDHWPTNNEEASLYASHAFSNCGAALGFLGRWSDAEVVFRKGRDLANTVHRKLDELRFEIDSTYCEWRAGRRREAIKRFGNCLIAMEKLSRTDKSENFHTAWKILEHFILWCQRDAGAPLGKKVIMPRPGICSESKSKDKHDLVKDSPRGPVIMCWYLLAEAELYADLGRYAFDRVIKSGQIRQFPNFKSMIEYLKVRAAISDKAYSKIPPLTERAALAAATVNLNQLNEKTLLENKPSAITKLDEPSAQSHFEETILCTLLVMSAEGVEWGMVLDQWEKQGHKMKFRHVLEQAIAIIRQVSALTPLEAYRKHIADKPRFEQFVAALRLVIHPESTPELAQVGLCMLTADMGFRTNLMLSHAAIEKLTRMTWEKWLANPFRLISPRTTTPPIRSALDSKKMGLQFAASVLLASGNAVNVQRRESTQKELRELLSSVEG